MGDQNPNSEPQTVEEMGNQILQRWAELGYSCYKLVSAEAVGGNIAFFFQNEETGLRVALMETFSADADDVQRGVDRIMMFDPAKLGSNVKDLKKLNLTRFMKYAGAGIKLIASPVAVYMNVDPNVDADLAVRLMHAVLGKSKSAALVVTENVDEMYSRMLHGTCR